MNVFNLSFYGRVLGQHSVVTVAVVMSAAHGHKRTLKIAKCR